MFPTLFHKQKYLEDSCGNTCKPLSSDGNFDARNLKKNKYDGKSNPNDRHADKGVENRERIYAKRRSHYRQH